MKPIDVKSKFNLFDDHWNPRIIAELNGQQVKVAKIEGEFVWHDHKEEDELFFLVKGSLVMEFRDKTVELKEGEMILVPRGVEHRPVAQGEAWIMLFEPASTKHTGEVKSEMTKNNSLKI
jgi:mannose-6-phosphate isomerase-like protein (cupin superfamily)